MSAHSDRGSAFMLDELAQFLHEQRVAGSQTTLYNPDANAKDTMA